MVACVSTIINPLLGIYVQDNWVEVRGVLGCVADHTFGGPTRRAMTMTLSFLLQ